MSHAIAAQLAGHHNHRHNNDRRFLPLPSYRRQTLSPAQRRASLDMCSLPKSACNLSCAPMAPFYGLMLLALKAAGKPKSLCAEVKSSPSALRLAIRQTSSACPVPSFTIGLV